MGPTWKERKTKLTRPAPEYPGARPFGRWRPVILLAKLLPDCRITHGAGACLQAIFVAALLLLAGETALAGEIKAPKISIAEVDWDSARAALNENEAARKLSTSAQV